MHVAIAIVGFRNAGDIVACLHALESSEHTDFEVVICENGGAAAFDALQAALPARLGGGQPVRIIMAEGNVGYAGGVNRAMAAAPDADAWWVLNPDTEAEPGALGAWCAAAAAAGRLRGGRLHDLSRRRERPVGRRPLAVDAGARRIPRPRAARRRGGIPTGHRGAAELHQRRLRPGRPRVPAGRRPDARGLLPVLRGGRVVPARGAARDAPRFRARREGPPSCRLDDRIGRGLPRDAAHAGLSQ
ncbi:MAG: glycosyltransferase [Phenylobacterium sp.]|nr:glycosyltransferase [Phenylobacterium sp.]